MDTVKMVREGLARLKSRIIRKFSADNGVSNLDTLFVVNHTKGDVNVEKVYDFCVKDASVAFFNDFEILFLDKGIFYGSRKHAAALETSFGGKIDATGNRHVIEYSWENTGKVNLTVPQVTAAILNIV